MFFVLYLQLFSKFRIVILKKKARKEVIFTEQSANFPQMQGWSYGVVPRRAALRRDAGSWGEGGIWRGRQRGLERLDWRSVLWQRQYAKWKTHLRCIEEGVSLRFGEREEKMMKVPSFIEGMMWGQQWVGTLGECAGAGRWWVLFGHLALSAVCLWHWAPHWSPSHQSMGFIFSEVELEILVWHFPWTTRKQWNRI